ncbi:hypothetical protein [Caballeronia concitans]|uniref:Phage integrase n=1 Tax=Caballeronia concitans TaxID=1777133 RepID=A0A658R5S6_9BURK|nr:hypothetical protein [Caballeronia concitans]SAL52352.1 Phage integrase [Caballeronia concitans]
MKIANLAAPSPVIDFQPQKSLYLLPNPGENMVSPWSKWKDHRWKLRESLTLNWERRLSNGTFLTDHTNNVLLDSFRRYLYSCMYDRRCGTPLSPMTAQSDLGAISWIADWMTRRSHNDFSTLDRYAFGQSIDDWLSDYLAGKLDEGEHELGAEEAGSPDDDEKQGDEVQDEYPDGFDRMYRIINLWKRLWEQTAELRASRIKVLPEDPLQGKTALQATKAIFDFVRNRIPQLPDEVALPIMNEAHKWVEERAEDIIRLNAHCFTFFKRYDSGNAPKKPRGYLSKKECERFGEFRFSKDSQTNEAWHPPVRAEVTKREGKRPRSVWWVPSTLVRRLVDDLVAACSIVIFSESGMRPGEVASIRASTSAPDPRGTHSEIRIALSISGLNELFMLKALVKKGRKEAAEVEWLLGARPVGSNFIPGPVKAVLVLEQLLSPWRALRGGEVCKWLFITKKSGVGLPMRSTAVTRGHTSNMSRSQRGFIARHVDLSKLPDRSTLGEDLIPYRVSEGRCLLLYQWRKSYAMYVIRTDRRMLPAIATQFKHMSVAITENAYVSGNIELLRERESQQARAAASFMFRRVVGSEPCGGRIAKLFDTYAELLREVIGDSSGQDGIARLQNWCEQRGIRVFTSDHGKCFIKIAPKESKCHEVSGTLHWSLTQPNFSTREPDLCSGCACFGVDLEHGPFWINRYIQCETAWQHAKRTGLTAGFRVIQERAFVAASMLRVLKIDLPQVN